MFNSVHEVAVHVLNPQSTVLCLFTKRLSFVLFPGATQEWARVNKRLFKMSL